MACLSIVQCNLPLPAGGLDTKRLNSLGSGTGHLIKKRKEKKAKEKKEKKSYFNQKLFNIIIIFNIAYRIVLANNAATDALNLGGNGSCWTLDSLVRAALTANLDSNCNEPTLL